MPEAVRRHVDSSHSFAPPVESFWDASRDTNWSNDSLGQVGAMHREIERRLLGGSLGMAVIPLPIRPLDHAIAQASRLIGWAALGGGFVGVFGAVATLLR